MKKQNFLRWYYSTGLREWFIIWRRFVRFIPKYFSMALLFKTLFSPWHRDISPKTWRGFDPIKSTEKIFGNVFSRIMGAIVRFSVIIFTLGVWLFAIVGGAFIIAIYIFAPIFFISAFIILFTNQWLVGLSLIVVILVIIFNTFVIYKVSAHKSYNQMDIMELNQQNWFYRVYERIGVTKENIPEDVLHDFEVFKQFLRKKDITIEEFEKIIAWEIEKQQEREINAQPFALKKFLQKRPVGLNWHFGYTTELDKYVQDLTRLDTSREIYAQFYGFAQEMKLVDVVLARSGENSVILTGEAGIGKHMIVQELARRIRSGYFGDDFMRHMRVLQCDFTSVIAEARNQGQDPESLIHHLFFEAAYAGNVILVVDELEKYMNTQDQYGFSFIKIINQYADLTTFRMIGITTEDGFHEYINDKQVFLRNFDVVPIHEMSEDETMHILFTRFYGKDHTPFTYQALRQIIIDSTKYANTSPLPARAIDLAMSIFVSWQKSGSGFIDEQTVDGYIREKTGVPVGKMRAGESEKLLSLEDAFHERIVGQDAAVKSVASAVRKMRSGMTQANKPAGSFLFLGPTGVGKTEMAKVLANQYYGSRDKVIRLDMSEFQGENALDRLIGSKELKQQGILTTAAREHPYALLLLDEIEKANPRVLDLFLQILDEGFLHDAFGRKVNFTTMIIIATSNAAALTVKKMVEAKKDEDVMKKQVINTIIDSGIFRPEFINRFGNVVIFQPLAENEVEFVVEILLKEFEAKMEKEYNIDIVFDEGVTQKIIKEGFDPVFGARSLIHYIDSTVTDALAKKLITGDVQRGDSVHFGVADME
jgi:ATP-dependent Clp protease ATP-binding subunit ClpC